MISAVKEEKTGLGVDESVYSGGGPIDDPLGARAMRPKGAVRLSTFESHK